MFVCVCVCVCVFVFVCVCERERERKREVSVRCQEREEATMMHSLVAPDDPTIETCYSRASKSPFSSSLTENILCVFCGYGYVCVLRVAIQACVWHRKGCDGNAVVETGYRYGSETLATVLGCGRTPLSPPESTTSHHNKNPAIWRSVGMPPSARVLASTTAPLIV